MNITYQYSKLFTYLKRKIITNNANKNNVNENSSSEKSESSVEENLIEEKSVEEKLVEEKLVEEKLVKEKSVAEKSDAEKSVAKKTITEKYLKDFQFPLPTWIVLIHELFERFSFYGVRVLFTVYLHLGLNLTDEITTIIYHLFTAVCYLSPIFGAVLADNYIGKFMTIVTLGIVYLIGYLCVTFSAINRNVAISIMAIFIFAIGAGGIKSCVSAFGADQIDSSKVRMIEVYFALFYVFINVGAFIAQNITPILRRDVSCFNYDCYALAFGFSTIFFILTYILLVACYKLYEIKPPSKNVLGNFINCIYIGMKSTCCGSNSEVKHDNILDYAIVKYPQEFIEDCKQVMNIIIIFLPVPIFWSLWDQQGSRFTLQATNMNGRLSESIYLKPEQIQSLNPLLIIILIPLFDLVIYPLCKKLHVLQKETTRMLAAYIVVALAFIVACLLEISIHNSLTLNVSHNQCQLYFVNLNENCNYKIIAGDKNKKLEEFYRINVDINVNSITYKSECDNISQSLNITLIPKALLTVEVFTNENKTYHFFKQSVGKVNEGRGYIRKLDPFQFGSNSKIERERTDVKTTIGSEYSAIQQGLYLIKRDGIKVSSIEIVPNGFYSVSFKKSGKLFVVKEWIPASLHVLWQIPQYILISVAEIFLSVTAMALAYNAAPESMKSLLQAIQLLTIFIGNLIVVISATFGNLLLRQYEFVLFAILALIAGVINFLLIKKFGKNLN